MTAKMLRFLDWFDRRPSTSRLVIGALFVAGDQPHLSGPF